MDYAKHYQNLINSRKILNRSKKDGNYYEKHHIIPRCLNGTNDKENLILLTAKEHFIAHLLLTQVYTGKIKAKMCCAFLRMCIVSTNHKRKISSTQYNLAKKLMSENYTGKNNPFYGRIGPNKGKNLSEATKNKLRKAILGKTSKLKGRKLSRSSHNKGMKTSEEIKNKLRCANGHKVIEYSLDGILLNIFNSIKEASIKTGHHSNLIIKCCKKKSYHTVGGIHNKSKVTFRYKDDIFDYVPKEK